MATDYVSQQRFATILTRYRIPILFDILTSIFSNMSASDWLNGPILFKLLSVCWQLHPDCKDNNYHLRLKCLARSKNQANSTDGLETTCNISTLDRLVGLQRSETKWTI